MFKRGEVHLFEKGNEDDTVDSTKDEVKTEVESPYEGQKLPCIHILWTEERSQKTIYFEIRIRELLRGALKKTVKSKICRELGI